MVHEEAQARCDQDSEDAGVPGFLHLPMPRNEMENQIYFDLISHQAVPAWLDILEVLPRTSPRSWMYKDGSPVSWFNWNAGEPNNYRGTNETEVQIFAADDRYSSTIYGKWNDMSPTNSLVLCTYFLPAGAETDCTWLHDFED